MITQEAVFGVTSWTLRGLHNGSAELQTTAEAIESGLHGYVSSAHLVGPSGVRKAATASPRRT